MSTKQMIGVLTVLAAVMLLAACAQSPGKPIGTLTVVPLGASSTPTRAPRPPTPTPVPATATITPRPPTATSTATAVPATLTFTSVPPTVTPSSQPSATVTVTPSPVVGPTVKIIYPTSEDPATVGQEVAVQFIATSDIGITDIELWVDGVRNNTMPDVNFTEQEITDTITWIPETAGEHTLAVLVYDKKGDIGEATVMVTAH